LYTADLQRWNKAIAADLSEIDDQFHSPQHYGPNQPHCIRDYYRMYNGESD